MSNTVAIIQARLGSTRLPGKVLMNLLDRPMLNHVVERVSRSRNVDHVVIAITTQQKDDKLYHYCQQMGWDVFRGSEHDVLSRYHDCAVTFQAEHIVRITSDCPLIDSRIIDEVVELQTTNDKCHYSSNFHPQRRFPRGLDVECFSMDVLQQVHKIATEPSQREHVTLMMYGRPDLFKINGIQCPVDLSEWRWTVDTAEDFRLVQCIYQHFGNNQFSWREAATAYRKQPMWQLINQNVHQKKVA